jgi:hypothetical protein
MVEQMMFFSGGFLVASLLAMTFMPVVHRRAVRITCRHFEKSVPLSVKETVAGVDGLRAEFAMSTRRLELQVERLKATTVNQFSEIGRLRTELAKSGAGARDLRRVAGPIDADTEFEQVTLTPNEPDSARLDRLDRRRHAMLTAAAVSAPDLWQISKNHSATTGNT